MSDADVDVLHGVHPTEGRCFGFKFNEDGKIEINKDTGQVYGERN